jgi:N-acyl amino acid synthase of PEP-CTERM/exosortase system
MMFDDRYEVFLADTIQAKNLHYHLRYQVYHLETGWERNSQVIRRRLERDRYDAFSKHFLVRDRLTHEWVGGMRLVVSPFNHLPLARVCNLDDAPSGVEFDKSQCVEVSRLFVLPDYRCGRRNGGGLDDVASHRSAGFHYEVMLGLIRAARMYGLNNGLKSWYFLVEPSLARSIHRLGIDLHCCGPEVDHHGVRRPYYGEVSSCFERIFSIPSDVCEMFSRKEAYQPFSQSAVFRPHFDKISVSFVESRRSGVCIRV